MKKLLSVLLILVLACSFSLVTAVPAGAEPADGDVTIVVQNQAGDPIEGATASLLFYGAGLGGTPMEDVQLTDVDGSATFIAADIADWLATTVVDSTGQIYVQPRAEVDTGTAYGKVRTVDPVDGFPIIPYNVPGDSLVPKSAMDFTYNMILMSTEPVQTVWDDSSNEFTVTATLADSLSVTPDVIKLRLIRNRVGVQPPAEDPDDDWYMWNGTTYESWVGIATVEADVTGTSVSATFSSLVIFDDWEDGNKIVVRPEFGVDRTVDGVPCIDDYYAVDILRPSSYIHPAQINDSDLFYPTIQDAIDNADPLDTINVAAGTYYERLNINKSLTLEGANVGIPGSDTRGPESIINPQWLEILDGDTGNDFGVIIYGADTIATFDGFTVENYHRVGILAGSYSLDQQEYPNPSVIHILNNIISEPIGQHNNNCIQVGFGTTGTIIGNEVFGAVLESPDYSGSGILVSCSSDVLVSNNYVHDCEGGIQIMGWPAGSLLGPAEDNIIEYNLSQGNESGIVAQQNAIGTIIRYNDALNNASGIVSVGWFDSPGYFPSGTQIHYNNIVGNLEYGVKSSTWDEGGPEQVDATNNWWGTTDESAIATMISGEVDYSPWWGESYLTGTAPDIVLVDHPWTWYTNDSIQDGIDNASSDDTVIVAAGTYDEAILIDKPLILRGATADVNKNGYTVPENYVWDDTIESIINHPDPDGGYTAIVDIYDTGNVTFEGFVVQELDAVANLNSSLVRVYAYTQEISNIVVRNNIIGPNTNTTAQDGAQGRMGLYIVNHPYNDLGVISSTFSGNKIFDCKGNGNNVFIWSSYFAYGAAGPASMSGTVIEDNEIYGSHRSGIETAGGFSGLTIRNNKIYGNSGNSVDDEAQMLKYGTGILMIRGSGDRTSDGYGPEDILIEGNEIYSNEKNGIYTGPIASNITITGNDIHDNGWDSIMLDLEGQYWNPTFDSGSGPFPYYDGLSNIVANFNNITGNGEYGARVNGIPANDFVLDATNNWWGTKAKGGIKQMVSENVDYDPWIGAKAKESKSKKTKKGDDTVDAKDETDTEVSKKGDGTPTITVTEYTDNPGDGAPGGFSSVGNKYIDVHLDNTDNVTEIEIRNYYTLDDIVGLDEATLKLSWWDGTTWIECSDSGATLLEGDPTYRGYVWAIIKVTGTTPTLDDMAGTAFMSMGTPVAVGGVGGGGGIRWPPEGTTDVRGEVSSEGVFEEPVTAFSYDELCTLTIPEGTVGLTEDLEPLDEITILREDEPPEPPEEADIVLAYDLGPDGATFDPAITLTFSYDPADIPEGKDVLVAAYYDEVAEAWVYLEGEVDTVTKTITVSISHFTTFAIIARAPPPPVPTPPAPAPPTVVAPAPPAPPAPPPAPPVPVAPPPTPEAIPPFNWTLLGGIIGVVVAAILLIFILMRRRVSQ